MTSYAQATGQQLRQAKSMAEYDVQRYKDTFPELAKAADRVRVAVLTEMIRRPRCSNY